MQPEQRKWESVMVETMFHNGVTSVGVDSLQTSEAAQWRRLRDVRAAHKQRFFVVELVTQWSSNPTEINSTAARLVVKR